MGRDTLIEVTSETSRILLDSTFKLNDLAAQRQGDDLWLSISGTNDGVIVPGYYSAQSGQWTIATIDAPRTRLGRASSRVHRYANGLGHCPIKNNGFMRHHLVKWPAGLCAETGRKQAIGA